MISVADTSLLKYSQKKTKSKAVPLNTMVALEGKGDIAPTHS
jgi:hypothetical protein